MPGVYCPRCQTNVKLEQDGTSCSNCGSPLVNDTPPTAPAMSKTRQATIARQHRRQNTAHTLAEDQRRYEHSQAVEIANNRIPEPAEGVAA